MAMIRSPRPQSSTTKSFGFTAGGGRSTNDRVVFAQHDHAWLPGFGFRSIHRGEAHDGEAVARFAESGGGTVEDNLAGAVCGCAAVLVTYLSTTGAILVGALVMISMLPAVAWLERAPYERQLDRTAA